MNRNVFNVRAKVWLYPGMAGWHFVTIPKKQSERIKKVFGAKKRGWGSLPVMATIGETHWETSIFPDKKSGLIYCRSRPRYAKADIALGDMIRLALEILA